MADAMIRRGPDDEGLLDRPGLGLANRRLSIIGSAEGRQPQVNEDRCVAAVFNGEFLDYPETKRVATLGDHTGALGWTSKANSVRGRLRVSAGVMAQRGNPPLLPKPPRDEP
jgi:asparagine synthetase B (glutamine-hydrolysing)